MPTEHDLTVLADDMAARHGPCAETDCELYEFVPLAQGYLALLTERDNLKRLLAAVAAERDALRKDGTP